jgi:hypothetical protein
MAEADTALPLVLGVTGHRHLAAEPQALRPMVDVLLGELQGRFAHTPLLLLSSLAEGADRLVAEAAAARGIPVVAVLPMRRQLYEADFAEPSRKEFNDWLDRRVRCWLEMPVLPGSSEQAIQVSGSEARNKQYAQAGEYVARHSQVLLVLWDGQPGKEGGTAQVFGYKLKADPVLPGSPRHSPLQPVEPGLICHLITPRPGQPRPERTLQLDVYFRGCVDDTGTERIRRERNVPPGGLATDVQGQMRPTWRAFWRAFGRLERFNRDRLHLDKRLERQRQQSEQYLLGEPIGRPAALNGALRPLVQRYAVADTLATHYQRWTKRPLVWLYLLVFLAVISFELHAHDVRRAAFLLGGFLLLLLAVLGIYKWSQSRDFQNKYQDYRALAEGLRIQLFWRLAGLSETQATVADHYLLEHASELDWIRSALRVWGCCWTCPQAAGQQCVQARSAPELDFVMEHWVGGQAAFFRQQAKALHRTERRLHYWTRPVFAMSVLLALAAFLLWLFHQLPAGKEQGETIWSRAEKIVLLLLSLQLVATALVHEYFAKLALTEQLKSYRRMRALFTKARHILRVRLGQRTSHEPEQVVNSVQELLKQLVEEALAENGDWVILRRGRPVDVPHFT